MNGIVILGIVTVLIGIALFIYGGGYDGRGDSGNIIYSIVAIFIFVGGLAMIDNFSVGHHVVITDPRHGEVWISDHVNKVCDGTTLVYQASDNVWGVPNSSECQVNK